LNDPVRLHSAQAAGAEQARQNSADVTIRYACPDDAGALAALAQLDSRPAPRGIVLVAVVGGELWAAVSLDDGHAVAGPFRPSGELTVLLADRARQLRRSANAKTSNLPRARPQRAQSSG
jgi:hypothetical protein